MKILSRKFISPAVAFLFILTGNCGDGGSSPTDPGDDDLPQESVDYGTQVQPVFDSYCVNCHGGVSTNGNLVLTSYSSLMSGNSSNGPVVTAGDGEGSILIRKLRGTTVGSQMPPGGIPLSNATIDLISQWIDEGALP